MAFPSGFTCVQITMCCASAVSRRNWSKASSLSIFSIYVIYIIIYYVLKLGLDNIRHAIQHIHTSRILMAVRRCHGIYRCIAED